MLAGEGRLNLLVAPHSHCYPHTDLKRETVMRLLKLTNLGIFILLLLTASAAMGQKTSLLTLNSSGTGGSNGNSFAGNLTPDGRYLVFMSSATDLVPFVTSPLDNIYVRDLQTGLNTLVSVNSAGTDGGNARSYFCSMTPNGRFVLFVSDASNLVPNDDNAVPDIFVRDLTAGTTTRVEFIDASHVHNNFALPQISPDGRFVVFSSPAKILGNDANNSEDIFVHDMAMGATSLVSVNRLRRRSGNRSSTNPQLSADGRYVLFESDASDLVDNDNNGAGDVFVRDLLTGTTRLASANYAGTGSAIRQSFRAKMSADGRFVVFTSTSNNLVPGYPNLPNDVGNVYLRDMASNTTRLVSVNSTGTGGGDLTSGSPVISANGRFVVFLSAARNLVSNDNNNQTDLFVRDMLTGTTVSPTILIPQPTNLDYYLFLGVTISNSGRFLAYSRALNSEPNRTKDIILHDLVAGTMTLVTANLTGTGGGNRDSIINSISNDERSLFFTSGADNLVPNDANNSFDIFVYRLRQSAYIVE